ncbi:MAG: DUF4157 domain-containing protein [Bacteroidota bacterium]
MSQVHVDKAHQVKSHVTHKVAPQPVSESPFAVQFDDQREETAAQLKMQEMANASVQVYQLMAFQEMADESPQVAYLNTVQLMADHYVAQRQAIQQKDKETTSTHPEAFVIQLKPLTPGKLNVVGENHEESDRRRDQEIALAAEVVGGKLWTESEFKMSQGPIDKLRGVETTKAAFGDPVHLRIAHVIQLTWAIVDGKLTTMLGEWKAEKELPPIVRLGPEGEEIPVEAGPVRGEDMITGVLAQAQSSTIKAHEHLALIGRTKKEKARLNEEQIELLGAIEEQGADVSSKWRQLLRSWRTLTGQAAGGLDEYANTLRLAREYEVLFRNWNTMANELGGGDQTATRLNRSWSMHEAAQNRADNAGIWKVGQEHANEMQYMGEEEPAFTLLTRAEFNEEYQQLPILVDGEMVPQDDGGEGGAGVGEGLQGKFYGRPMASHIIQLQAMANASAIRQFPLQHKQKEGASTTAGGNGLPSYLKSGIQAMSGYSMDDVTVHYNSNKPAQLNAHAHAQGTNIHLGSGQEKHLPHEAWHVVQQKQGRVKPTIQMKGGVPVNDDQALEKEADVMGAKAASYQNPSNDKISGINGRSQSYSSVVQRFTGNGTISSQDGRLYLLDDDKEKYQFHPSCYRWLKDTLVGLNVKYTLNDKNQAMAEMPREAQERVKEITNDFKTKEAKTVPADHVGLVAAGHAAEASVNPDVRAHMGHIAAGAFTSKKDQRGQINVIDGRLKQLIGDVGLFYKIADHLKLKYQSPPDAMKATQVHLYRAIATGAIGDSHTELLPSSTSFSLAFVKEWASGKRKENYQILEIIVPITYSMLMMAYPEDYKGLRYPEAQNQAQSEVTLAPSIFQKMGDRVDDGYHIVTMTATELEPAKAMDMIQQSHEYRGEDISDEEMFQLFGKFKEFYSLKTLVASYSDNFEAVSAALSENSKESETQKRMEIVCLGKKETMVIELLYDVEKQLILGEIKSWEEIDMGKMEPYNMRFSYNKRNIGDIYALLQNLSLDRSETFVYLCVPSTWTDPDKDARD